MLKEEFSPVGNKIMKQCQQIKPDGKQCGGYAVSNSPLCFSHNPDYKEQKALAVTKGGQNRKLQLIYGKRLTIENPQDIQNMLSRMINGVWMGKIPANEPAKTVACLAKTWLEAYELGKQDERLKLIEEKLKLVGL